MVKKKIQSDVVFVLTLRREELRCCEGSRRVRGSGGVWRRWYMCVEWRPGDDVGGTCVEDEELEVKKRRNEGRE